MARDFLKSLRRRSRASFRTDQKSTTDDSSETGSHSQGTGPASGFTTPASISHQSDPALNLQLKEHSEPRQQYDQPQQPQIRPPLPPIPNAYRHSVSGMSGLGAPPDTPPGGASSLRRQSRLPVSQYAPRIRNAHDGMVVYQKVLLLNGVIGDNPHYDIDGTVTVTKTTDDFPPITWPVYSSQFKALVYLRPGHNALRFDFSSPKVANSGSSNPIHTSYILIHMIPPLGNPPLQLAILLGKDSPGLYDAPPARVEREGHGLDMAIKKFRMAAYLWQAFTAEQMMRHKLGRRTFRFDEEWTTGTANLRDQEEGTMRSEAKIHIIRSEKTVAEIRDLNYAQQNSAATKKNALFDIAATAVRQHFHISRGEQQYVTVLILDAHWDSTHKMITGHAALGSGQGDLKLSIFGSHCLHSYPASFEEIVPAFTDCTPTDTNYVANDSNEAGSSWEAANIGLGAHLHEVGHSFGCPHQESGIMLRDYVVFNRTFVAREAYSMRTKSRGGLCAQSDECDWHRLDALRFRAHPAFRLANEPQHPNDSVQAYPTETAGTALVVAASGISFVEIFAEGDDVCRTWLEVIREAPGARSPKHLHLSAEDLANRLPPHKRTKTIKVSIKSCAGASLDIEDFKQFASKQSLVELKGGRHASRGANVGRPRGGDACEVILSSAAGANRVLSRVVVFHGAAVDGLKFIYDDASSQLFGKTGGKAGGDVFELDVRRGEVIAGFHVRAGAWIDGIQIITSLGRKSPMFGNPLGGELCRMIAPPKYHVCGVSGSCSKWLDTFAILVKQ